jgi:hypothetical protein
MATNINASLIKEPIHPFVGKIPSISNDVGILQQFFDLVFKHNGYISGGYAILVARAHCCVSDVREYTMQVQRHLGLGNRYINRTYLPDIDVFFPNETDELQFVQDFKTSPKFLGKITSFVESEKGFAYNINLDNQFKIQLIQSNKFVWNTIEEVLSSFDILNCSVAVNDKHVIMPASWKMLEENKQLHVAKWGMWTITRILKYFRKGYNKLTDETLSTLYTGIEKYAQSKDIDKAKLRTVIAQAFGYTKKTLTNKQLIDFSMILPSSTYDGVFKELEKRNVEQLKQQDAARLQMQSAQIDNESASLF